eukprot:CAMPEP_0174287616 /NCGR_PEP_ID=MMETSP0809-20121228/16627_1 /TAXON_ID=73025 ORGANISM="Eutreptiella gymnastica-like, Strain CCMP1594" /NCGR_SAMPLE_ID=MMETSP0809 /ASSEMBLY_ACC=CAM_ASM_000658 /LENGTH=104 /DNA_ID=CAMNT_0015384259 /DNA_START=20 /DNA_END=330 /DNA_ORIENTATION=+
MMEPRSDHGALLPVARSGYRSLGQDHAASPHPTPSAKYACLVSAAIIGALGGFLLAQGPAHQALVSAQGVPAQARPALDLRPGRLAARAPPAPGTPMRTAAPAA